MVGSSYKRRLIEARLDSLFAELPALFVTGPRAAGKTTTLQRRAKTSVRLDVDDEAAAFRADPDVALRNLTPPVLLDEWQNVPGVLGAVKRSVDSDPSPGRFLVTGSVSSELESQPWPATGRLIRVPMYPMTVREQRGITEMPTFFDKLAAGTELVAPSDPPDILGYLELAVAGGFPTAALELSDATREAWLESYIVELLTRDINQLKSEKTARGPNREALRRYFEAWALNTAGAVDHKRLYEAAGIDRQTAVAYDRMLLQLFMVEELPAWATNRIQRLVKTPKRYVIDPSLVAAQLRIDAESLLYDADLRGRIIDTFVAAQLRPEVVVSDTRPRLYHLRTREGRHEVDLVAELAGFRVIGIEIKAGAAPTASDAKHLIWLRDELGERFVQGVVFHTGRAVYELADRVIAAPIAVLWT